MRTVEDEDKQPAGPLAKQALSHPERSEMLALITRKGTGADAAELAEALGISIAKAKYHLMVLRSAELVESIDEANGHYVAILGS